jgi:hypothetical protein
MARFILIDNDSGYIWGDTLDLPLNASDLSGMDWREAAETAARALDQHIGGARERTYVVEERNPADTSTGYHVYRVDVRGSDVIGAVFDGQDQETIDAVTEQGEYFAYVRVGCPADLAAEEEEQ